MILQKSSGNMQGKCISHIGVNIGGFLYDRRYRYITWSWHYMALF